MTTELLVMVAFLLGGTGAGLWLDQRKMVVKPEPPLTVVLAILAVWLGVAATWVIRYFRS